MSTIVSPTLSDRAVSNITFLLKAPASHPNAMISSSAVIITCSDPAVAVGLLADSRQPERRRE
jgi:hypothetical protein